MTHHLTARLRSKVAIVTGAGAGIGAETARTLAAQGATVAVVDLALADSERIADEITAAGGTAIALAADVSDEADVAAMVEAVVAAFGRVDILHNNAALTSADHLQRDGLVADIDVANWDRTMAVNARGPMLCCKYSLPHMVAGGGGSIINVGSGKGKMGDMFQSAYGASKAAVTIFTKYVAVQYGKQGVRANSITLGAVMKRDDITRVNLTPQRAAQLAQYDDHHLTPFLGNPRHIADAVAFLASDESVFITGEEIAVDGGFSCHLPLLADTRRDLERQEGD